MIDMSAFLCSIGGLGTGIGVAGLMAIARIDALRYRVKQLSNLLAQDKTKSDAADRKLAAIRQLLDES